MTFKDFIPTFTLETKWRVLALINRSDVYKKTNANISENNYPIIVYLVRRIVLRFPPRGRSRLVPCFRRVSRALSSTRHTSSVLQRNKGYVSYKLSIDYSPMANSFCYNFITTVHRNTQYDKTVHQKKHAFSIKLSFNFRDAYQIGIQSCLELRSSRSDCA